MSSDLLIEVILHVTLLHFCKTMVLEFSCLTLLQLYTLISLHLNDTITKKYLFHVSMTIVLTKTQKIIFCSSSGSVYEEDNLRRLSFRQLIV